jgi:hypothetical protein
MVAADGGWGRRLLIPGLGASVVLFASTRAAAQEPALPVPTNAAENPAEQVEFEPDDPALMLLARTGEVPVERMVRYGYGWYHERGVAPRYSPICLGACSTRFVRGEYHLALSRRGGSVVEAETVLVTGPSAIHAHYVGHGTSRALGAILGIAGTIAGAVMIAASVHSETLCYPGVGGCYSHETVNGGLMAGGIGVVVGAVVVGSILATRHDEAMLGITPLALPPAPSSGREAGFYGYSASEGAALTVRF